VLPSIKSIREQWKLPKVHSLFYKYFFKPVIQGLVWNDRINAPNSNADDRLGTMIAKAYAGTLLVNHYFPWLYQYKIDYPNNTLVTEYDQRDDKGGNDNDHQETEIDLFYGDLDLAECKILLFVCEMFDEIKQGKQSGICKKWEDMYKKILYSRQPSKAKPKQLMRMMRARSSLRWMQTCCTQKFNVAFNLLVAISIK
jgi:hypothetical protein